MKLWRCILADYPDDEGFTVGKVYKEHTVLIDNYGNNRQPAYAYNRDTRDLCFKELTFNDYLEQIQL